MDWFDINCMLGPTNTDREPSFRTPEALLEEARGEGALGLVTTGYGVASWYLYSGEEEKGVEGLREILASGAWAGFGYIAAEADLLRLGLSP